MEKVYTVYDRTAQQASDLFICKNDGVATRQYGKFLEKSPVNPDEYQLLCVGEYSRDDPVGLMSYANPKVVALTEE